MNARRWLIVSLVLLAAGCGKEAIVAPSGSQLTLATTATALSFNGAAAITAKIVNADGTIPPDGTVVTFSATLGSLQPTESATANGVATVTFNAGVASGTAVVTGRSGNAGGSGGIRIAVGVAAVSRVTVVATPPAVPFGGGTSTLVSTVTDASGTPLLGIPVTFTTTAGTLTPSAVKTDVKGLAQSTLTTNAPATVTATAAPSSSDPGSGSVLTVAGSTVVTVAAQLRPAVSITASANPTAQSPTTFTIAAIPAVGGTAVIQDVMVNFGDGRSVDLGAASGPAISVQHVYTSGGTYTVTVTAVDSAGASGTASTVLVVAFSAPLSVTIMPAGVPAGTNTIFTFTAVVTPASIVIGSYEWEFGDGTDPVTTSGNQIQHVFKNGGGPYTITVTVDAVGSGQSATAFTIISP